MVIIIFCSLNWGFLLETGEKDSFCHWEHDPIPGTKMCQKHPLLCILKDFPTHIDRRSMGLSIVHFKGSSYCTGDGGYRDKDGYLWITGRIDDMLNVSGHLLSTAEIESALVEHKAVTEAAVVSHPHPIKGECTYSFVTTKQGFEFTDELAAELKQSVRTKIGAFAVPDFIQDAPGLPKTRSGKIMRRVLRKIAVGDRNIGDVSTLADETVVDTLFSLRPKDA